MAAKSDEEGFVPVAFADCAHAKGNAGEATSRMASSGATHIGKPRGIGIAGVAAFYPAVARRRTCVDRLGLRRRRGGYRGMRFRQHLPDNLDGQRVTPERRADLHAL